MCCIITDLYTNLDLLHTESGDYYQNQTEKALLLSLSMPCSEDEEIYHAVVLR